MLNFSINPIGSNLPYRNDSNLRLDSNLRGSNFNQKIPSEEKTTEKENSSKITQRFFERNEPYFAKDVLSINNVLTLDQEAFSRLLESLFKKSQSLFILMMLNLAGKNYSVTIYPDGSFSITIFPDKKTDDKSPAVFHFSSMN